MQINTNLNKLAYHEGGHYLISFLLLKENIHINIEVRFPTPFSIQINESLDNGQVENSGFPIHNWDKDAIGKITDYVFEGYKFFKKYKILAVGVVLSSLAGHISDFLFVNIEKRTKYSFGKIPGEMSDFRNYNSVIDYVIGDKYGSTQSLEFIDEKNRILQSFTDDLIDLFLKKEVKEAIDQIVSTIIATEVNQQGERIITREKLNVLDITLHNILKNINISDIIYKYL